MLQQAVTGSVPSRGGSAEHTLLFSAVMLVGEQRLSNLRIEKVHTSVAFQVWVLAQEGDFDCPFDRMSDWNYQEAGWTDLRVTFGKLKSPDILGAGR